MSVTIEWDSPHHTALILTFAVPWTWDEYEILSDTIQEMFNSEEAHIDLIIDLRHVGDVPPHILNELREAYSASALNLGEYIFVGATPALVEQLMIADRYFSALGGNLDYRYVSTLDDAKRISFWKFLTRQYNGEFSA